MERASLSAYALIAMRVVKAVIARQGKPLARMLDCSIDKLTKLRSVLSRPDLVEPTVDASRNDFERRPRMVQPERVLGRRRRSPCGPLYLGVTLPELSRFPVRRSRGRLSSGNWPTTTPHKAPFDERALFQLRLRGYWVSRGQAALLRSSAVAAGQTSQAVDSRS